MTPQAKQVIQAAVDTLGAAGNDDWKVEPTRHAADLEARAPGLAEVLCSSALKTPAQLFEEKDKQAGEAQTEFKRTANRANWAVLLTTAFSALLLIAALVIPETIAAKEYVLGFFGFCGVISGACGAMWVHRTREGALLHNWMSARAEAEALRWQYFEAVINAEIASGDSPNALLFQFEYFRRYELDVQIKFYTKRAAENKRDADNWTRLSSYSVAGAAIAAGVSGLHPKLIPFAALGAVATALGSFAATKDVVNQSRRNADLYNTTGDALVKLAGKLDDVRVAAAAGEREPVKQFVTAVHEQLAAEHRQWLQAAEGIQPAIDKLEQTLSDLQAKRQSKQPPGPAQGEAARA